MTQGKKTPSNSSFILLSILQWSRIPPSRSRNLARHRGSLAAFLPLIFPFSRASRSSSHAESLPLAPPPARTSPASKPPAAPFPPPPCGRRIGGARTPLRGPGGARPSPRAWRCPAGPASSRRVASHSSFAPLTFVCSASL